MASSIRAKQRCAGACWGLPNLLSVGLLVLALWLGVHPDVALSLGLVGLAGPPLLAGLLGQRFGALGWLLASAAALVALAAGLLTRADAACLAMPDCRSHSGFAWIGLIWAASAYFSGANLLFALGWGLGVAWRRVQRGPAPSTPAGPFA